MKLSHLITAALIGTAALAASAQAADPATQTASLPSSIVIHSMDGKTSVMPVDTKMAGQLLGNPNTKPLTSGVVIFVANGRTYMIEDQVMPSGKTLVSSMMDYDLPDGGD